MNRTGNTAKVYLLLCKVKQKQGKENDYDTDKRQFHNASHRGHML